MSMREQRDIAVTALKFIADRGWGGIVCETYARRELDRVAEVSNNAVAGWRPIETAPEGKYILLASTGGIVVIARWNPHTHDEQSGNTGSTIPNNP